MGAIRVVRDQTGPPRVSGRGAVGYEMTKSDDRGRGELLWSLDICDVGCGMRDGSEQLFRLTGNTAIEKIPCDHVNGDTIIYWEDIEQVFPGVKQVKNGDTTIKLLRDSNENR
ncbi:MAG: hypothetical protein J3Q66DRAFT_388177 [Benniella sp.]|nr:MAG: hypothetical protein J3Q66DRAFT_388177 [Benniella sp.]